MVFVKGIERVIGRIGDIDDVADPVARSVTWHALFLLSDATGLTGRGSCVYIWPLVLYGQRAREYEVSVWHA